MHATSFEPNPLSGGVMALCGNDAPIYEIGSDAQATCWECRSIID